MTLEELRDALANATGPDRELDFPIHCLRMGWKWEGGFSTDKAARDEMYQKGLIPEYTASIDTAVTLVPDWLQWECSSGGDQRGAYVAFSEPNTGHQWNDADAATLPLALCLARVLHEIGMRAGGGCMSAMSNGTYRTEKGSTVKVSGTHSGKVEVVWDWFEEGACCNARVNPYPVEWDEGEWRLTWDCDCCGSGSAVLQRAATPDEREGDV